MSIETHRGSCHYGRARYEADFDLSDSTSKCNPFDLHGGAALGRSGQT